MTGQERFEKWAEAKGFVVADLKPEERTALEASHQAEMKKQGVKHVAETPATEDVPAEGTAEDATVKAKEYRARTGRS